MRTTLKVLFLLSLACAALQARTQAPRPVQLTISGMASGRSQAPVPCALSRGGAPYNDECANAVVQVLPYGGSVTMTGDNTGATDTESFGNPNVWEAFTIDTCSSVTVSYCGTNPAFGLVYSILLDGCPGFVSVQNSGTAACGDGNTAISYADLSAGTYYIPVLLWPGLAEGPYVITVTSTPCSLPPANDACAAATPVPVLQDCATGGLIGFNSTATQSGNGPSCGITSTTFQDVFYRFQSGSSEEVTIFLEAITAGDIGVEVRDACGGAVLLCATGDTLYTLAVDTGASYIVRVYSNNDLGLGGSFSLCVQGAVAPPLCDGGIVQLPGGGTFHSQCFTDTSPLEVEHLSTGTVPLALALTDTADVLIAVLYGTVLDPTGLVPGTYRVHGLSADGGLLNAQPGGPLALIASDGACADVGETFLTWTIDICQQVIGAGGAGRVRLVGGERPGLLGLVPGLPVTLQVHTVNGQLLSEVRLQAADGLLLLPQRVLPAQGPFVVVADQVGVRHVLRGLMP